MGDNSKKRISNPQRKARRAASWKRGEARKLKRNQENEARARANLAELKALGGTQQPYERVVERKVWNSKTREYEVKTLSRTKLESPGSALARVKRGETSR